MSLNELTSSLSMFERKFIITLCFLGYFWHRALIAWTTTTWKTNTPFNYEKHLPELYHIDKNKV